MMMNQIELSIIIPCFNVEETVASTIQSLNQQKYNNFEVLFIDGNSGDETLKSIKKNIKTKNIIISEPDDGIYDAMNKGLNVANGEWIYVMGADDTIFDSDTFLIVSELFNKADFIYGSIESNFFTKKRIVKLDSPEKLSKKYNHAPPFFHQSVFIKKSVLDEIGGFSMKHDVHSDMDLMIKAFNKSKKVLRTDTIVANYNASGFSGINFNTFKKNTKEFRDILKAHDALDFMWRIRLLKNYYYLFYTMIMNFFGK